MFTDDSRITRARLLTRAAARLSTPLNLNGLAEEIAHVLNVPIAAFSLYDAKRDVFDYAGGFGLPPDYAERVQPVPHAVYQEYAKALGSPSVTADVQALSGEVNAALFAALSIRSIVNASMVCEGQLVGSLSIATIGEVREFSDDELEFLQVLAHQTALSITNVRLLEEAKRRLNWMQALHNVDMAISASLDLRVTLNVFLDQLTMQLGVDAANVLILNPFTQSLEYGAGRGFRVDGMARSPMRRGEGYAMRVAFERRMLSIPNLAPGDHSLSVSFLAGERFVAYYGVPLIAKGMVRGVLEIFHRSPLNPDQEWLDFLEMLAGQAAIAIDNAEMFYNLQRTNDKLARAYDHTLEGWSRALDLRDHATEGHTQRVAAMTLRLAREMGVSDEELVQIRRGALLHDIGKMGIPDGILLKPGPLTEAEWEIMRRHPVYAYELLAPIDYLGAAPDIPYCHHEKWDGSGYPRGLKGEQIPLAARIFAVVDVWDALRSDRPYRPGWPEEDVRAYIQEQSGKHFDPKVVELFFALEFRR